MTFYKFVLSKAHTTWIDMMAERCMQDSAGESCRWNHKYFLQETRKEILYVPFWIISLFQVKFNETLRLRMILIGSKWTLTATSGYQLSTPRRN